MQFIYKTTSEISEQEWKDYQTSFNETFERNFTLGYFKRKYENTYTGYSCHAFLLSDEGKIVGGVTAIPLRYDYFLETRNFGSLVDLFIVKSYRKNPLLLRKLYRLLEKELKKEDISFVYAVPNSNSYTYLVKVCKWKDIGRLNYFALPIKVGNVLGKAKFLNLVSIFGSKVLNFSSRLFSSKTPLKTAINIHHSSVAYEQRFELEHQVVTLGDGGKFGYRVYEEEGKQVAYLIDCTPTSTKHLAKAIQYITKKEPIEIILFIGLLKKTPLNLVKIPMKYEPNRTLNFVGKILLPEKMDERGFDLENWSFSLFNFDVR